jgi:hypothetical protein
MDAQRISYLLQQQVAGLLTEGELNEWQVLLSAGDREPMLAVIEALIEQESFHSVPVSREVVLDTYNKVIGVGKAPLVPVHRIHFLRKWGWAAAAVLLVSTGSILFLLKKQKNVPQTLVRSRPVEIPPGKNGAMLTLADGRQIELDSLGAGVIATQNGTKVTLKSGQLAYENSGKNTGEIAYNTMSTPRGRQFHIRLPDGTEVWLNAASSIRYPTSFSGKDRVVDITGEAYFEVAKNVDRPFKIAVNGGTRIDVLGTHFNVNAYPDEPSVNTTLLEGAVRVLKGIDKAVLKPGQQARVTEAVKVVDGVDVDKVMAWKNGFFNFEGMQLREVMQQLARWYDIEVVYEGNIPDVKFYGELSRDMNLSGIIAALKDSDVHFRIEGRKLIVLP